MNRWDVCRHNLWQTLICLDQLIYNVGGLIISFFGCIICSVPIDRTWADETLSSRAWRWKRDGIRAWPANSIDAVFWIFGNKDHCKQSYENEINDRQKPPEMRETPPNNFLEEEVNGCLGGISSFYNNILGFPPEWEWCCDEHDVAYNEGGSSDDRALADKRLRNCISGSGHNIRAWVYWAAVRIFAAGYWTFK